MTKIVPITVLYRGKTALIEATQELVRGALLAPDCRDGLIQVLWQGFADKPFKLNSGFEADNQLYLGLRSPETDGLLYVCNKPREYQGRPVTRTYPFDKYDIRRVLTASEIDWSDEHLLD